MSISDKKIRVLQLWDDYLPTFTGAAIRHNAMGIALDEAGVNVNVLTQAIEGSPLREHINGVDITRFVTKAKKRMRRQILLSIKCCRAVWQQRNDFDILHSLSVNPLYIPVLLTAKLVGKPVIVDFTLMRGNNFSFFGRILYGIADLIFSLMDAYVVISTPLKDEVVAAGLREDKCEFISYGVDIEHCAPLSSEERSALRTSLGILEKNEVLVFSGSIVYRKGVDILMDAMPEIVEAHPEVVLILVGPDEFPKYEEAQAQVEAWKRQAEEGGLGEHVSFVGIQPYDKAIEYLQAGDVFVFPSRREGLGRVIVEAMSIELPCVVSELDGIAYDMIEPEVNGIVIKSLTPHDFAREINRVLEDENLRVRFSRAAREKVVRDFDERNFVQDYVRLFQRLV